MIKKILVFSLLFIGGIIVINWALWTPLNNKNQELKREKEYWKSIVEKVNESEKAFSIIESPNIIDQCRQNFTQLGVLVEEVNISGSNSDSPTMLIYMKWQGMWDYIIKGLIHLEDKYGVYCKEILLNKDGGEGILKVQLMSFNDEQNTPSVQ